MRRLRWALVASVALISCVPEVTVAPPEPGTVSVVLAASTIIQGSTTQATANASDSRGRALTGEPRNWTSSAPGVASVSASGVVTGVTPGTANITATVLGRSASAAVTVTPSVATVNVTPATATRTYADTIRFSATALASGGAEIPGRTFTWAITTGSSFASIATTGLVTPVLQPDTSTRTVVVSATTEGRTGTATLTLRKLTVDTVVLSATTLSRVSGDTVRLTAQPRHTSGTNLTQRVVTWASSNTAVATVSATGLVTALTAGTSNITATSEGKVTTAALTVTNTPVQTVDLVLPTTTTAVGSFTIGNGRSQQLATVLRDASGNVLTGRTVTWASSNSAVVSVNSSGVVTGAGVSGSATITATSEGRSGSVAVTIGNPVTSVAVPASFSLSTVQSTASNLVVRDVSLVGLPNRVVTVTSSNPAVFTVTPAIGVTNASGVLNISVRGVAVGSATLSASSEGSTGSTTVTVSNAVVSTVVWEGYLSLTAAPTIGLSRTLQAVVTARDASSNIIPGRSVTWTSSNVSAVSVNTSGVVSGVGSGSAVITATVDGVSTTRTFTTGNPVATIGLSTTAANLVFGNTANVTVTPRDAGNVALGGRPFTAVSADTTVARVGITGTNSIQITSAGVGSTTVTVSAEGVTSTVAVTVTPVPVASVTVTGTSTIVRGNTTQLTATVRDASSNILTGRSVSWTSSNTAVATVSTSGLVTGVGVGSTTITATSEGVNGTLTMTVQTDVASVVVTPSTFTLTSVGATQQLTADPRNSGGTSLVGRTVTWSSLNTSVATVSTTGVVSAVASGSTTIRATVDGIIGSASVTVSITVDPCTTVTAHTLGTTVNGSVTTADCFVSAGEYEDRFSFTTTTTRLVSYTVTPTGGSIRGSLVLQQNTSTGPSVFSTFSTTGTSHAWYGPGTYHFRVENATTPPVSYSFTTNGAASLSDGCFPVPVAIGSGLNFNWTSTTSACNTNTTTPSSGKYYNRWWIYLNASQQVTLTMTSTAFDTFLELWTLVGSAAGTKVAEDDDGAGGTNSRITFTATTAGFYEVRATTFGTNVTGLYNLAFATSPTALMAPDTPAAQERVSVELPAPRP